MNSQLRSLVAEADRWFMLGEKGRCIAAIKIIYQYCDKNETNSCDSSDAANGGSCLRVGRDPEKS